MDELRKDPTRGQWVLIRPEGRGAQATDRAASARARRSRLGNEIAAYRKEGSPPNSPDWSVRVVPEPDAYFRIEWELVREGVGMFDMITPRGASELIIESPAARRHARHDAAASRWRRCCGCTATGCSTSSATARSATSSISRRHRKPGVAGHHPYSRVTAIPIVFDETRRELREAREYYQYKRRCLYCDILRQEIGRRGAHRHA